MAITAGEYGYDLPYFRRMLQAQAVDVLQADATRCAGITGFLGVAALCEAFGIPLSSHCAPALHLPLCCAARPALHLEYFHDHARIERMLFDGAAEPRQGLLAPDLTRPGLGLEFKEQDARMLRNLADTGRAQPAASVQSRRCRAAGSRTQARDDGRSAFRRRQPGAVRHRCVQLPPGPDRRSDSAQCRRRDRDGARLLPARRAGAVARRRHQPVRPMLQCRGGDGFLQVPATRCSRSTRTHKPRACSRAWCSMICAHAAERAWPDLRARPRHA